MDKKKNREEIVGLIEELCDNYFEYGYSFSTGLSEESYLDRGVQLRVNLISKLESLGVI